MKLVMEKIDFGKHLSNLKESVIFEIKNLLKGRESLDLVDYEKDEENGRVYIIGNVYGRTIHSDEYNEGYRTTISLYRIEKRKGVWMLRWNSNDDYVYDDEKYPTRLVDGFYSLSLEDLSSLYTCIYNVVTK